MEIKQNTYKVLNTQTNEIFDATFWNERKSSYLVHFNGNILPFSKKTGKLYGRSLYGRNILRFYFYELITIVEA
jgi:hypothetical protein